MIWKYPIIMFLSFLVAYYSFFSFFFFLGVHFSVAMGIFPVGTSGRFPQGKPAAASQSRATQPLTQKLMIYKKHTGSFRFPNPLNSDMDYRIFNVRT